jgi:hypothetical protein
LLANEAAFIVLVKDDGPLGDSPCFRLISPALLARGLLHLQHPCVICDQLVGHEKQGAIDRSQTSNRRVELTFHSDLKYKVFMKIRDAYQLAEVDRIAGSGSVNVLNRWAKDGVWIVKGTIDQGLRRYSLQDVLGACACAELERLKVSPRSAKRLVEEVAKGLFLLSHGKNAGGRYVVSRSLSADHYVKPGRGTLFRAGAGMQSIFVTDSDERVELIDDLASLRNLLKDDQELTSFIAVDLERLWLRIKITIHDMTEAT